MKSKELTLQNGIKVVYSNLSESESICVYLLVNAGSNQEKIPGLAHFVEHVLFKGTKSRPKAYDINNEVERVGGYINAATSQEYTEFYIKIPSEFAATAIDILSDITKNSLFDEEELEREKSVITEEINMYEDMPIRSVSDSFYSMIWKKNSLGRSILGTPESIASITRKDVIEFINKFYVPENMIISVAGNLSKLKLSQTVNKYFGDMKSNKKRYPKVKEESFDFYDEGKRIWRYENTKIAIRYENRNVKQTHFCFGIEALSYNDKNIYSLIVASAILSEGSGSYLWQKIREEMGASYYLSSEIDSFDKTGVWYIHSGVEDEKFPEVLSIVVDAFKKLKNNEFNKDDLLRAKEYLKGDFILNLDDSESIASYLIHEIHEHGFVRSIADEKKLIDSVTLKDISQLVEKLYNSKLYLNILTKRTDVNKLRDILNS